MTQPNDPTNADLTVVLLQLKNTIDALDINNVKLQLDAIADKLQKISGQSGVFEMRDMQGKMNGTRLVFQGMNVFIVNEPDTRVTVDEYERQANGGMEPRVHCQTITMDQLGEIIRKSLWPEAAPVQPARTAAQNQPTG